MQKDGEEIRLTKREARAGITPRVTRYMLAVSLALVVVLFAGLLFIWR